MNKMIQVMIFCIIIEWFFYKNLGNIVVTSVT